MADTHSKEIRSYNMSRIRGKNTKPEILVRKFLYKKGYRYRLHVKGLPGKPDVVLKKYKTVIFIHGCFWHGHEGCKYYVLPKSNTDYWLPKIQGNIARGLLAEKELTKNNWKIVTVWECELKENADKVLNAIVDFIERL
ncbi:MAG TPA: very short patch repair endonuclease [Candidatus Babeliaceae bacterium]|nr:very short patch repair endonuclease [Candidatus Babeliaceae bacterium]